MKKLLIQTSQNFVILVIIFIFSKNYYQFALSKKDITPSLMENIYSLFDQEKNAFATK